jgi:hypothetical protein
MLAKNPLFEVISLHGPTGPLLYCFFIRVQNYKKGVRKTKNWKQIRATDPYQDFLFVTNSPVTREWYSTRLRAFFVHIGIKGLTMQRAGHK